MSKTDREHCIDVKPEPEYLVEFDPESHRYYVDGELVPSVTQVLKEAGFVDDSWFTEWSSQRGTYVHQLCAIYDQQRASDNQLYPSNPTFRFVEEITKKHGEELANEVMDYFVQYVAWRKTREGESFQWAADGIEQRVFNPEIFCAGTLDRRTHDNSAILDIKTSVSGQPPNWVDLQTVGYALLAGGMQAMFRRFSLTLSRTSLRLDEYPMGNFLTDRHTFLCALHTVREVRARR